MIYEDFLQFSNNNIYFTRLSINEWLEFKVDNQEDLNNVKLLNWDKLNFSHFKDNKLYEKYVYTKN